MVGQLLLPPLLLPPLLLHVQTRQLLWQPEAQGLLEACLSPGTLIILVMPYKDRHLPCPDDGVRLLVDGREIEAQLQAFGTVLHHVPHRVLGPGSVEEPMQMAHEMVLKTAGRRPGCSEATLLVQ